MGCHSVAVVIMHVHKYETLRNRVPLEIQQILSFPSVMYLAFALRVYQRALLVHTLSPKNPVHLSNPSALRNFLQKLKIYEYIRRLNWCSDMNRYI
jgi:hypothetical protein